ncbi:MAG: dihydrolipoyllysine-residue acetyltransferase [Shewanella sp.]|nr:dihydrolipoyllysine-residue acetyltransferase [Shewanella sp.]MCF1431082.1 dihydrolipoyllysine-residue acetyltransferase [Shewanella sp.]
MIKDFILPDIGEGVVECELVDWLVSEGELVTEDQPIADVMTDKALVQIPAPFSGRITKLYYAKGEIAKVHMPLYSIDVAGSEAESTDAEIEPAQSDEQPEPQLSSKGLASSAAFVVEDFLLPDIGEGIQECELIDWLVSEGDFVVEDQPIADVMTDKALVQIPAIKAGKIIKLHYRKGQLAQVHAPLFAIEVAVDTSVQSSRGQTQSQTPGGNQGQSPQVTAPSDIAPTRRPGKALASPAVRRLARSHDLDLSLVPGSGKNGRVYKEDVQCYLSGDKPAAAQTSAPQMAQVAVAPVTCDRVEPIRGVQAVMARAMQESVSTIPHFTYCEELDITDLMALRQQIKAKYGTDELKITLMPFFMKAMSLALNEFPVLNSHVNRDCTEITYKASHNIGMAVDSKVGLLVPNVKEVQAKSILDIAVDITRLTKDARSGRVQPADLKGGTISISNIGALGGTVATPIINKPEVAIVALGKVQLLPRFNAKGEVQGRQIMQVSWSGDHRVIDGGTIARFCNLWKHYLESPAHMLMGMR